MTPRLPCPRCHVDTPVEAFTPEVHTWLAPFGKIRHTRVCVGGCLPELRQSRAPVYTTESRSGEPRLFEAGTRVLTCLRCGSTVNVARSSELCSKCLRRPAPAPVEPAPWRGGGHTHTYKPVVVTCLVCHGRPAPGASGVCYMCVAKAVARAGAG